MPSGWGVYYIVFLSALIALGIPIALTLVSCLVSRQPGVNRCTAQNEPPRYWAIENSHDNLGQNQKMNTRFFLGVNATLALIALLLILIPCVGVIRNADGDRRVASRSLFAVLTVAGIAGLGLLYCSRKGDLSWIRSFQNPKPETSSIEKPPV